jgi:hypothetical protein
MPNNPAPCTNCLRFHYGVCREAPKQCFQCGGLNHIERYCPLGRRVPTERKGPLPGTRVWCEMFGVNDDPDLKNKVLNALKTAPGCSIWVNERCIYQGNEKHFTQDDAPQGRPLEERVTWGRSRSPPRERQPKRSQSPPSLRYDPVFRDWDPYTRQSQTAVRNERFRSRSPLRRRSPYCPPPPPRSFATGSNATGVEPRQQNRSVRLNDSRVQVEILKSEPTTYPAPLGQITNVPHATVQKPTAPNTKPQPAHAAVQPSKLPTQSEPLVEDPWFVLGVSDGASEAE